MTRSSLRLLLAPAAGLAAATVVASPAGAHVGSSVGGLGDGLAHPVTGLDHLLAMVAVGVVAGVAFEGRRRWLAPGAFLGAMVVGAVAGLASVPAPGAEVVIVGSVIALGIAIAAAVELRSRATSAVVALLVLAGLAHGHAHGAEVPDAASPLLYIVGFVAATATLHLVGLGVGAAVRDRSAVRLGLGAATAAAGTLLLLG